MAYKTSNLAEGKKLAEQVLAWFPTCPIPKIKWLGKTLKRWSAAFLTYSDTHRSRDSGTEVVVGPRPDTSETA